MRRRRSRSKIDALPEIIRAQIDELLGDPNVTYQQIADHVIEHGYEVSTSSIGRYVARLDKAQQQIDKVSVQVDTLIKGVRENQDIEATEVASALLMEGLIGRIVDAEEEFAKLPIDKAARIVTSIQRSGVYRMKVLREQRDVVERIRSQIMTAIQSELQGDQELRERLTAIVSKVTDEEMAKEDE